MTSFHPPRPQAGPTSQPGAVQVIRSDRRRRTVSAYRDGNTTVVRVPARMSRSDEERWVATMVDRLARAEARRAPVESDLDVRAAELSRRYLAGRAVPARVRWVANQHSRWGSCTPATGEVRLSRRLAGMPSWVVDYVLLHELAHLIVVGHGPAFWQWVRRYPRCDRARGYLEGVAATAGLPLSDEADDAGSA